MYYANCLYEMLTALELELLKKKIYCIVENRKINSKIFIPAHLLIPFINVDAVDEFSS